MDRTKYLVQQAMINKMKEDALLAQMLKEKEEAEEKKKRNKFHGK